MPGSIWKRLNWLHLSWLDDVLIPLSVALMQATCIAPILSAILRDPSTHIQRTGFVFWLCLGVILAGAAVARLAQRNSLGAVIVVVGAVAAISVSLMVVIPPEATDLDAWLGQVLELFTWGEQNNLPTSLVVVVFVVFMWWRGLRTVQISHSHVLAVFLIGMVVQLILLFAGFKRASVNPVESWRLMGQVILFFLASLSAFAFYQISYTLREQQRKTGVHIHFDRYWLTLIVGASLVILAAALLVGQVVSPDHIGFLRPLWVLIRQIFLLILFVFAYLFFALIGPLLEGIAPQRPAGLQTLESFVSPQSLEEMEQGAAASIPPIWFQIFQTVLIIAAIGLVVWLLIRTLRKRKTVEELEEGVVESRESVLSWDLVRDQIENLFDQLRRRPDDPFLNAGPAGDPRRLIREMYQKVLSQAAALERPRSRGQTPRAYVETLATLCPQERESLHTLTEIYIVARYHTEPLTAGHVTQAQEAFARIDAALHARLEEKRSQAM